VAKELQMKKVYNEGVLIREEGFKFEKENRFLANVEKISVGHREGEVWEFVVARVGSGSYRRWNQGRKNGGRKQLPEVKKMDNDRKGVESDENGR